MKKSISLIACLLFFFNVGFAQSKFRLGIVAGPNYASYSGFSYDEKYNPKIAFTAGLTSEYRVSSKLYVTADLLYERKRTISDSFGQMVNPEDPFDPVGPHLYFSIQNDYIVLPVQVKYEFTKKDAFYFTIGAYAAYLVNSEYYNSYDDSVNESDAFMSLDFGLSLGIGKSFNINNRSRINLEFRENLGLSDIKDKPYFNGSVNTNSLNLICGYSFDLK